MRNTQRRREQSGAAEGRTGLEERERVRWEERRNVTSAGVESVGEWEWE